MKPPQAFDQANERARGTIDSPVFGPDTPGREYDAADVERKLLAVARPRRGVRELTTACS